MFEVGDDETPFIVMPYIEGETLAVRLSRTPLSPREVTKIATEIASALSEAHNRGVIHRDIKPQNIMLTAHGHVKLMGFGLAKLTERAATIVSSAETGTQLTTPHAIAGTVSYMSPEQARGDPLDARSDLFSLGSTLFAALSGRPPFIERTPSETMAAVLMKEPPPLRTLVEGVPESLARVVGKCLEKDLGRRYQTSGELLVDLQALRDNAASHTGAAVSRR